MPLLATVLISLFAGLCEFLLKWMTTKAAVGLAAVATFATLTAALFAGLTAILAGISAALPSFDGVQTALWVACPDNLVPTISATIACDTAIALYKWNVTNLNLIASSN